MTQFYRIWRKYSPATFEPGTDRLAVATGGLGIPARRSIASPASRFWR